MCGEKAVGVPLNTGVDGSPPRVRGKVATSHRCPRRLWITPACAGKRAVPVGNMETPQDHPRVCGEKRPGNRRGLRCGGSPPRVRGKVSGAAGDHRRRADHPRVCGEKAVMMSSVRIDRGSPPRVRGKVSGRQRSSQQARITPACAGKRARYRRRKSGSRDHPRVCGEKTKESLKK